MDWIFEVVKIILPAVIAGTVTYWVTKYNKRPTDKIEISYNRIYHPLMKKIKEDRDKNDYKSILIETQERLIKYNKYASKTTSAACKLLSENIDSKNVKRYYQLLEDDIYKYNSKFRRVLGYPEPFMLSTLKYLSTYNRVLVLFWASLLMAMISIYGYGIFSKINIINIVFVYLLIVSLGGFAVSGLILIGFKFSIFLRTLIKHLRKK